MFATDVTVKFFHNDASCQRLRALPGADGREPAQLRRAAHDDRASKLGRRTRWR
ncbi:MAG: hypothetical protein MZV63_15990 [Marinilabiliales bacterium]|nr:hypothetical protein [Marinilabiliales bacterium]